MKTNWKKFTRPKWAFYETIKFNCPSQKEMIDPESPIQTGSTKTTILQELSKTIF